MLLKLLSLLLAIEVASAQANNECQRRHYYKQDSFVCVCNSLHCDYVEALNQTSQHEAITYTTSLKGDRLTRSINTFERTNGSKQRGNSSTINLTVYPDQRYQNIIGFGGAITDSSMKIYNDLKVFGFDKLQDVIFNQYYGPTGISYNLGRVPIASCDFSLSNYSYLDKYGDFELESFSLQPLDFIRAGFLAKAQKISPLRLFSSPWSAPAWIKTNGQMQGGGSIIGDVSGKYYQVYAKYFVRFFEEYAKQGVKFWATTIQNEPGMAGQVDWQSMEFAPPTQKAFVKKWLRPLMEQNWASKDVKILAHDNFRGDLEEAAKIYYKDEPELIDGLAFHWYDRGNFDKINKTHELKPDKILLLTEACNGYATEHQPQLGSWQFAENYAYDIIQTLLNYGQGWTDWNVWLDEQGPNYGIFCKNLLTVNASAGEFYKQPMYYILGHFSKFVLPDSVRIEIKADREDKQLETVAFETPEHNLIVILLNLSPNRTLDLSISVAERPNKHLKLQLEAKSIKTLIWKK